MKAIDYWWVFLRGCAYLFLGIAGFELLMRNGSFLIPLALGLSLYAITDVMYVKYVLLGKHPNADPRPFSDSKEE